jgi:hypothetical protein
MSGPYVVRHVEVPFTAPDGERVFGRRGETVELNDADAERLVALGSVVPPGTDISPPVDDRPWSEVLQESADRRYDTVTVP